MKQKISQLINFIRQHKALTALALAVLLLAMITIIRGRRAPSVAVPPPGITGQVPNQAVRSITYTGEPLTLPDKMTIYRNNASDLKLLDLVKRIAAQRSLTPSPHSQTLWVSAAGSEYVHLDQARSVVTYGRDLPPADASAPEAARAQKVAQQWVKDTLSLTTKADEANLKHFTLSGSELVATTTGKAEIIEIPLNLTIGNYPVVIGNAAIPVATVSVGRNHTITRAILKPFALAPVPVTEVTTIDFATIVANLKDQGEIVSIMPREPVDTVAHPPTEITLTEAQIQYRLDPLTQLVYPYIVFTGTTKLESESAIAAVTVIAPAASTGD